MKVNLYEQLEHVGKPPVVVKAVCEVNNMYMQGGAISAKKELHHYVLVSSLPPELQEKIKLAVQLMASSI